MNIENPNKFKPEKSSEMTRRDFLTLTGGAAAGVLIGAGEAKALPEERLIPENIGEAEVDGIDWQDQDAAEAILGKFKLEDLNLSGREVKEAATRYQYEKHTKDPKFRESLEEGISRMSIWITRLKEEFGKNRVPEDFVFLALPESYWDLNAGSPAGARGAYQFTEDTGKKYGLKIGNGIDERTDPLKSSRACAKYLKYLYGITQDWDLALSAYNGGFVGRYLALADKNRGNKSYDGFVKYVEKNINELKKDLRKDIWSHVVKSGENLGKICKKYGVNEDSISKLNGLRKDSRGNPLIFAEQKIKIPIDRMEVKERIYEKQISGYVENLNFPGKYYGIMAALKDPNFQKGVIARAEKEPIELAKK